MTAASVLVLPWLGLLLCLDDLLRGQRVLLHRLGFAQLALVELLDAVDVLVVILLGLDVVRAGQHVLLGRLGVLQLTLVELGQLVHGLLLRHLAGSHILAGRGLLRLDALQLLGGEALDAFDQALVRFLGLDVVGGGEDVLLGRLDVLEVARAEQLALERVANLGQVLHGGGVRHVGFGS